MQFSRRLINSHKLYNLKRHIAPIWLIDLKDEKKVQSSAKIYSL